MTIKEALHFGRVEQVESEILLAHVMEKPRTWAVAHPDALLSDNEWTVFCALIKRRQKGEPIAYILGKKEFYGRFFNVHPSTLIPRPATEHLIELTLNVLTGDDVRELTPIDTSIVAWMNRMGPIADVRTIVDVGTGSGCIAITLAHLLPTYRIIATDISAPALEIAQKNALEQHVEDRIDFRLGSGLDAVHDISEPFFIVSNPPYIPDHFQLEEDVRNYEPHTALFAGTDGTSVLCKIAQQASKNAQCRGWIMECREEQPSLVMNQLSRSPQ